MHETLKKHNIKNKIENIGFFDKMTKIEHKIQILDKMVNNNELIQV
jgi:hypothetical protein